MGDILRKQKRQIDKLLAARKIQTDATAEVVKLKKQIQDLEQHWRLDIEAGNKARQELAESRAQNIHLTARYQELAATHTDVLTVAAQLRRSLDHEKQVTALLDKEVSALKQAVDKLNVDSLPKTRRRLAERTAEVEQLRRSLAAANSKIAELESSVSYHKRTAQLVGTSVQTQAHTAPQAENNQS